MSALYSSGKRISIHALREEGDTRAADYILRRVISIHALREEGDRVCMAPSITIGISIHALREEGDRTVGTQGDKNLRFQSTPSARRATAGLYGSLNHNRHFNPRPPRGGRPPRTMYVFSPFAFQSTPSARRATDYFNPKFQNLLFQSTPSARRATYLFHYW